MRTRRIVLGLVLLGVGCSDDSEAPGPAAPSGGVAGVGGASGTSAGVANGGGGTGSASGGAAAGSAGTVSGGAGSAGTAGSAGAGGQAELGVTLSDLYCAGAAEPFPDPLAGSPQPVMVAMQPPGGISFLEGPVWLAEPGVLLLSEWNDQHRILQLTPPQSVEVYKPMSRTNGLVLAPDRKSLLVVTEMPSASVSRLDLATKQLEPVVAAYEGEGFVQPNDLAVKADGTLFFTDYQAGRLYRRSLDGELSLVSSLAHSNGVGVSPDETTLYLMADTLAVKYPLAPDGTVGAEAEFASDLQGADGLAIDCAGNVYIAENNGSSVVVVSAAGQKRGELSGLPKSVTNAAFGGPDRKTLYITTSSALYSVALPIPGLPY